MKVHFLIVSVFLLLSSCTRNDSNDKNPPLVSIQTIDRHGFSETISTKERVSLFKKVDFFSAQSYQKVLRVFARNSLGKTQAKITSYHSNGLIWQYLDVVDGRANGLYEEWHENGKLKIRAHIIEGLADLGDLAQSSWVFDGESLVWDAQGNLIAKIPYFKGHLEGLSQYFHPNGKLWKSQPYEKGVVEGTILIYDDADHLLETIPYHNGLKQGESKATWTEGQIKYEEKYEKGLLKQAKYFNNQGELVGEIHEGNGLQIQFENSDMISSIEYLEGKPEGLVCIYSPEKELLSRFRVKNGKKHGEEWRYYTFTKDKQQPKLMISWYEDMIQGVVKTWYENGNLESEREMHGNKKQGLSFAYYKSGDLMMAEEYEHDKLIKGSYFKKGEKQPASQVNQGMGIVSLFDADGFYLKKISYEKGKPVVDGSENN